MKFVIIGITILSIGIASFIMQATNLGPDFLNIQTWWSMVKNTLTPDPIYTIDIFIRMQFLAAGLGPIIGVAVIAYGISDAIFSKNKNKNSIQKILVPKKSRLPDNIINNGKSPSTAEGSNTPPVFKGEEIKKEDIIIPEIIEIDSEERNNKEKRDSESKNSSRNKLINQAKRKLRSLFSKKKIEEIDVDEEEDLYDEEAQDSVKIIEQAKTWYDKYQKLSKEGRALEIVHEAQDIERNMGPEEQAVASERFGPFQWEAMKKVISASAERAKKISDYEEEKTSNTRTISDEEISNESLQPAIEELKEDIIEESLYGIPERKIENRKEEEKIFSTESHNDADDILNIEDDLGMEAVSDETEEYINDGVLDREKIRKFQNTASFRIDDEEDYEDFDMNSKDKENFESQEEDPELENVFGAPQERKTEESDDEEEEEFSLNLEEDDNEVSEERTDTNNELLLNLDEDEESVIKGAIEAIKEKDEIEWADIDPIEEKGEEWLEEEEAPENREILAELDRESISVILGEKKEKVINPIDQIKEESGLGFMDKVNIENIPMLIALKDQCKKMKEYEEQAERWFNNEEEIEEEYSSEEYRKEYITRTSISIKTISDGLDEDIKDEYIAKCEDRASVSWMTFKTDSVLSVLLDNETKRNFKSLRNKKAEEEDFELVESLLGYRPLKNTEEESEEGINEKERKYIDINSEAGADTRTPLVMNLIKEMIPKFKKWEAHMKTQRPVSQNSDAMTMLDIEFTGKNENAFYGICVIVGSGNWTLSKVKDKDDSEWALEEYIGSFRKVIGLRSKGMKIADHWYNEKLKKKGIGRIILILEEGAEVDFGEFDKSEIPCFVGVPDDNELDIIASELGWQ